MLLSDTLTPACRSQLGKMISPLSLSPSFSSRPLRYAVLGAGFAGLSVTWHLLKKSPKEKEMRIDIYDEVGIGGGASGISGGLLHPYSPKAKLLWRGAECWKESLMLLNVAEAAAGLSGVVDSDDSFIVRRRGILRPAINTKNLNVLTDNAQNCDASCRIETIDEDTAQKLVPNIHVPFNSAFYMPEAVNVHPLRYLQALFLACQDVVNESSTSSHGQKELYLLKKSVQSLLELEGEYDAVIICLGAKADMLPELSGRLPLRTCRGVIAHLQLPANIREEYPDYAPSILSDAWLAVQGSRSLYMGSTWEWKSRNSNPNVSMDEASRALQELLPKISAFYPAIRDWTFTKANAGLRAMPPLTAHGSLPLLGCVNNFVGENVAGKYWLFGGLGSRGLLYHAWLGNLMAQAVISCNEQLIPSELTAWKNINR
ncbi:hypothetical protein DKX38_028455 [Salix brachista]|uniref:FAD dependent oxidoreductase domain-containing protein n=1 Tax=Salix brachista TaxID=2182728 RepID=A0A5N5J5K5_9ROSI|nr:hypothetical protein DKX38_028455 [Salix brachista]